MTSIDQIELIENFHDSSILITGGNGLIASALVNELMLLNKEQKLKNKIYVLCRNKDKAKQKFFKYNSDCNFNLIIQDVCHPLNSNIHFNFIIHAASNAHPLAYSTDPVGTMKTNIIGVINLLEYARRYPVKRFMLLSSSEIYGENPSNREFYEDSWGYIDTLNPRSCYSESKRAAETLAASYMKQYGINIVVVRFGYIYGADITDDNSRADAQFLRKVITGEDIVMKSEGLQLRSYCYVEDAVSATLAVLLKGKTGEAYNIANPFSTATIKEFAQTLARCGNSNLVFDIPQEIERQGYSVISKSVLNADKLMSLGWSPKFVSLEEGIKETLKKSKK